MRERIAHLSFEVVLQRLPLWLATRPAPHTRARSKRLMRVISRVSRRVRAAPRAHRVARRARGWRSCVWRPLGAVRPLLAGNVVLGVLAREPGACFRVVLP